MNMIFKCGIIFKKFHEIFVNPYSDDLINFLSYRDFYYLHEKGLVGIQFEYLKAYKNKIIAKNYESRKLFFRIVTESRTCRQGDRC